MLTQARLAELLDYNPVTGHFSWKWRPREHFKTERAWKIVNTRLAGKRAGSDHGDGYRTIGVDGVYHLEQRLAWLFVHGEMPNKIDHENGSEDANDIVNLRDVSHAENMKNKALYKSNKSGHPGVVWEKAKSLWAARIPVNGKLKTLGRSKDKAVAVALRKAAEADLGYHVNHGRAA